MKCCWMGVKYMGGGVIIALVISLLYVVILVDH